MTYELKLDLVGGKDVENLLSQLKGLSASLSKSGSIFGGSSGASKQNKELRDNLKLLDQVIESQKKIARLREAEKNVRIYGIGTAVPGMNPETAKTMISSSGDVSGLKRLRGYIDENGNVVSTGAVLGPAMKRRLAIRTPQVPEMDDIFKKSGFFTKGPAAELRLKQDMLKFYNDMALLQLPLMRPGSPWGIAFAARGVSKGLLGTAKGRGLMGAFGLSGASGAMLGATALVAGATAIGVAFMGLKKIVEETTKAYENARQLYAKALQSGMGLKFTTQRSLIAGVMGVSETEVFRFGAQMAYLNPRLAQASKILAETAIPLAKVSWQSKILGADMQALAAKLANDAAPAVMLFLASLDNLVKFLTDKSSFLLKMAVTGAALTMGPSGAEIMLNQISSMIKAYGIGNMPSPQGWMKQLPASTWEHMGLVVGGDRRNYNKETANNTARLVHIFTQKQKDPIQTYSRFGLYQGTSNP